MFSKFNEESRKVLTIAKKEMLRHPGHLSRGIWRICGTVPRHCERFSI